MRAAASEGRLALQRCTACGHVQYPPRACCAACLADAPAWDVSDDAEGAVVARTVLHHSNEARFRAALPLCVGLVRLDAGPVVVCFAPDRPAIGERVRVRAYLDETGHPVLEAR